MKGGVCKRQGAYRNPNDESTAFASCFGSGFEDTTVPSKPNPAASVNQGNLPEEVVVCEVEWLESFLRRSNP